MAPKGSAILPGQSIRHLFICAGGILGFIILAIYPYHKSLVRLDKEIIKTESQIQEQELLFPIGKELLKGVIEKETWGLPFPEKSRLGRDKAADISVIFEKIARKSNLEVIKIIPDIKSLTEQAGFLSVTAVVKGKIFSFREFFIEIGKLPYLEHVEEIQIQPAEGVKEFRLKVWLALKK
ncbi:MAG: hypothetical protein JRJ69_14375 [Deltaproteobacteria bacterium]|nr:hypothetical protein [Deltaproteobacteria bacterium]MBW1738691.1 hypothetical protein [Deltaproteobacteria bacterium]MBW1911058.1 hypothetical protein [Deltaproteobacteria bacterium]MBW2035221.1 hypothetical protein [Deltaproteobacteria bacterium]MBW2115624.1 hypothetical protein [Deltaproteobacteria bacterium]